MTTDAKASDPALQALVARIRARAASGDLKGAIGEATSTGAGSRDPLLERELVHWRVRAFDRQAIAAADACPPTPIDLFPTGTRLPEVCRPDLSVSVLTSAMSHHGCLLVRGLLDAGEIELLRDDIDHAFADYRPQVGTTYVEPVPTPWYAHLPGHVAANEQFLFARGFVESGFGILAADSPRSLGHLIALFDDHGIVDLAESYFGERPVLSVGKTTLRRVPPTLVATGWHQDGAFLGPGIRSLNVWLTLSDCGEDACGLDLVPRRFGHIVETGTGNAPFSWAASDEAVESAAGAAGIVTPLFRAGDALLFDHMLMHRTGLPPGRIRDRYAIESWFFAPTAYPVDQMPMWV